MTLDNQVDGAVRVGIDALKRAEQAVAAARDYAESTVEPCASRCSCSMVNELLSGKSSPRAIQSNSSRREKTPTPEHRHHAAYPFVIQKWSCGEQRSS
jgi:hypothetical protein